MIERVYHQAKAADYIGQVIVATDDNRILAHCNNAGIPVIMTSGKHQSGTDRVAEVAQSLACDVIFNIQGDEPFIPSSHLDKLASVFDSEEVSIGTLFTEFENAKDVGDYNRVKVVFDCEGRALYFSRSAIPCARAKLDEVRYYLHVGVYAFRKTVLLQLAKLPKGRLEQIEQLEQLRWLEYGHKIQMVEVNESTLGIDTPDDLARAERWLADRGGV